MSRVSLIAARGGTGWGPRGPAARRGTSRPHAIGAAGRPGSSVSGDPDTVSAYPTGSGSPLRLGKPRATRTPIAQNAPGVPDDHDTVAAGVGPRLPAAQAPRAGAGVRVTVGQAHVFYPEATDERCTAALLLEVDPVALVRGTAARRRRVLARAVRQRPPVRRVVDARGRAGQGRSAPRWPAAATRARAGRRAAAARGARAGPAVRRRRGAGPRGCSSRSAGLSTRDADAARRDRSARGATRATSTSGCPARCGWPTRCHHLYVLLPVLDGAQALLGRPTTRWTSCIRAGGDWLAGHPERET